MQGQEPQDAALARYHAGEAHLQAGAWGPAAQAFRAALALHPGLAEAHANLGYVLDQEGDHPGAEACYRQALVLNPQLATVHCNLGALLALQRRHAEAEDCYAAAMALEPGSSALWSNLGVLNIALRHGERAEACLRQALALDPHNARARFNLATVLLRQGAHEEGWALFESRDWYRPLERRLALPRWQGEPLAGRRLLLCYEAGHGDVIQFCRYVPLLKARGADRITLLCHPALKDLLTGLPGLDAVCAFDEALDTQAFDCWSPLLSCPHHLGTRSDTLPAAIPYLHADPARLALWAPRLPGAGTPRIGLVWKGNPAFENDARRSLPHLRALSPLWQVAGLGPVQFISLQKGAGETEPAEVQGEQPLCALGPALRDFADAAAVVAQLDLLISVDTAMAHLAGALGTPCWLLLPWYMADWRWGEHGHDTPWYPGVMRLFRQPADGDWASVMAQVALALAERFVPQARQCP